MVDFSLSPEICDFQTRIRAFVAQRILPLEADPASFDAHENIAPDLLEKLRRQAKSEGLWALSLPKERGGQGLSFCCGEDASGIAFADEHLQKIARNSSLVKEGKKNV